MSQYPLHIAILWHMHQPFYKDLETGEYLLPWVRLHAIKDYYDMVAILDDYPEIKLTLNLVPSLLEQIEDYLSGQVKDYYLELTFKKPESLSLKERTFILKNFFSANRENMIAPYPRYRELLSKRGGNLGDIKIEEVQRYFTFQDILDLQVWFNLSWFDFTFKEGDPFIRGLISKDRNYTEEEKIELIRRQFHIMSLIIGKYRDTARRGQIELTTSPFYHPILPLICDTFSAKEALPKISLPDSRFSAPEDAAEQVNSALDYFQKLFGFSPSGMWPSEGSVSPEAVSILHRQGLRWLATDEEILAKSLSQNLVRDVNGHLERPEILYQPYRFVPPESDPSKEGISILFRDHYLSDLIGFVYSGWEAEKAADDFISRLEAIQTKLEKKKCRGIVSIILDGENAWEYYAHDGRDFLQALYRRLTENPQLKTCTFSEYLEKKPDEIFLPKLFSGSWINHDFKIWIGHAEDNKAWDYLNLARKELIRYQKEGKVGKEKIEAAWKALYIAEGSDWCWWFGDDHPTQDKEIFDYLYRRLLIYIYNCLGAPIPDYLHVSIVSLGREAFFHKEPRSFISPEINGEVSNYFDWYGAGTILLDKDYSTMHRSEAVVKAIYYGFNLDHFYLRLDVLPKYKLKDLSDYVFNLNLSTSNGYFRLKVIFQTNEDKLHSRIELDKLIEDDSWRQEDSSLILAAAKDIVEIAIPLYILDLKPNQEIRFHFILEKNGQPLERQPARDFLYLHVPDKDFEQLMWQA